jgi:hypothetical protein
MDDRPRYTDRYSKKLTQMTTNVQFGRQATWRPTRPAWIHVTRGWRPG